MAFVTYNPDTKYLTYKLDGTNSYELAPSEWVKNREKYVKKIKEEYPTDAKNIINEIDDSVQTNYLLPVTPKLSEEEKKADLHYAETESPTKEEASAMKDVVSTAGVSDKFKSGLLDVLSGFGGFYIDPKTAAIAERYGSGSKREAEQGFGAFAKAFSEGYKGMKYGQLANELKAQQATQTGNLKSEGQLLTLKKAFEATPEFKNYSGALSSFNQLLNIFEGNGGAAANIAGVYTFMRALDPTSTVREGEYATAQNAAGVPTIIANWYNKLVDGEFLGEKQKKQFVTAAYNATTGKQLSFERALNDYKSLANTFGIPSETPGLFTDLRQLNKTDSQKKLLDKWVLQPPTQAEKNQEIFENSAEWKKFDNALKTKGLTEEQRKILTGDKLKLETELLK